MRELLSFNKLYVSAGNRRLCGGLNSSNGIVFFIGPTSEHAASTHSALGRGDLEPRVRTSRRRRELAPQS